MKILQIAFFIIIVVSASVYGEKRVCIDPGHDIVTIGKTGPVFFNAENKKVYAMLFKNNDNWKLEYFPEDEIEFYWNNGWRFYDARFSNPVGMLPYNKQKDSPTDIFNNKYNDLGQNATGQINLGQYVFEYAKLHNSCGLVECDINFKIATNLKKILEQNGTTVFLTKNNAFEAKGYDVRANIAYQNSCDYLIGIHNNAGPGSASYPLVLQPPKPKFNLSFYPKATPDRKVLKINNSLTLQAGEKYYAYFNVDKGNGNYIKDTILDDGIPLMSNKYVFPAFQRYYLEFNNGFISKNDNLVEIKNILKPLNINDTVFYSYYFQNIESVFQEIQIPLKIDTEDVTSGILKIRSAHQNDIDKTLAQSITAKLKTLYIDNAIPDGRAGLNTKGLLSWDIFQFSSRMDLHHDEIPTVLVECGFHTSQDYSKWLSHLQPVSETESEYDNIKKMASSIAVGILNNTSVEQVLPNGDPIIANLYDNNNSFQFNISSAPAVTALDPNPPLFNFNMPIVVPQFPEKNSTVYDDHLVYKILVRSKHPIKLNSDYKPEISFKLNGANLDVISELYPYFIKNGSVQVKDSYIIRFVIKNENINLVHGKNNIDIAVKNIVATSAALTDIFSDSYTYSFNYDADLSQGRIISKEIKSGSSVYSYRWVQTNNTQRQLIKYKNHTAMMFVEKNDSVFASIPVQKNEFSGKFIFNKKFDKIHIFKKYLTSKNELCLEASEVSAEGKREIEFQIKKEETQKVPAAAKMNLLVFGGYQVSLDPLLFCSIQDTPKPVNLITPLAIDINKNYTLYPFTKKLADVGCDDSLVFVFSDPVQKYSYLIESEHSYEFNKKNINNEKVYLITGRFSKIKYVFKSEYIDTSIPATIEIAGKIAQPWQGSGFVNGWTNINSSTPVWVGLVDFGENWASINNKKYPVNIKAADLTETEYALSENIIFDSQPPSLEFINDLCKLDFNALTDAARGKLALNLVDNISERLQIGIRLVDDNGNNILDPISTYVRIRDSSGNAMFALEDVAGLPTESPYLTIKTQELSGGIKKPYLAFQWDGKDIFGALKSIPKAHIELSLMDEAGNAFQDMSKTFSIDFADLAKKAMDDYLDNLKNIASRIVLVDTSIGLGDFSWGLISSMFEDHGVQIKRCSIKKSEAWESDLPKLGRKLKGDIDDFCRKKNEKAILLCWGDGGLIARQYLKDYGGDGKIVKLVNLSVPLNGINSIAQTPESYSIYLALKPILTLISTLGLDSVVNSVSSSENGEGAINMVQKINRNDAAINPLNFLGLLLGRTGKSLDFQAGSSALKPLQNLDLAKLGITQENINTALWPDMTGLEQAGIVTVFGLMGFAGVYQNTTLFSMGDKSFNNLDAEMADMLSDAVINQMSQQVFGPLWRKTEESLRDLQGNIDGKTIAKELGVTRDTTQLRELKQQIHAIAVNKNLTSVARAEKVRNALNASGVNDIIALCDEMTAYNDKLQTTFNNIIGKPVTEIRDMTQTIKSGLDMAWMTDLIKQYKPSWMKKMTGSAVDQFLVTQVSAVVKMKIKAKLGCDPAVWVDQVDGQINTAYQNTVQPVADIVQSLDGYCNQLHMTTSSVKAVLGGEITVDQAKTVESLIDDFIAYSEGDIERLLQRADALSGDASEYPTGYHNSLHLYDQLQNLKEEPVRIAKTAFSKGVEAITAPVKQEVSKTVAKVISDSGITKPLEAIKVPATIPGSWVGMAIMGVVGYLGSDYLKNSDLVSEGSPTLISRLMGRRGSQSSEGETIQLKGWFGSAGKDAGALKASVINNRPVIYIHSINNKKIEQYPIQGDSSSCGNDFKYMLADGAEKIVTKVQLSDFIGTIDGIVADMAPTLNSACYSFNFESPKKLNLDSKGVFKIVNPRLLEGRNVLIIDAYNGLGKLSRASLEIVLDMMPPTSYPIFPDVNTSITDACPLITGGLYDSGLDTFIPTNTAIFIKRMNSLALNTNDTSQWTRVLNADISKTGFSFTPTSPLTEGSYGIKVRTRDNSKNESESVWGFYVDRTPPQVTLVHDHLYAPSLEHKLRILYKIEDNVSGMIQNMVLKVVDENGQLVKVLDNAGGASTGGSVAYWDGLNSTSNAATSGNYYVVLSGKDGAGNVIPLSFTTNNLVKLDSEPPMLTVLSHGPDLITADDRVVSSSFQLNEDAGIMLKYINQSDNTFYIGAFQGYQQAEQFSVDTNETTLSTTNKYSWDLNAMYQNLPDGIYNLQAWACDAAGNLGEVQTFENIRVDRTRPEIYNALCQPLVAEGPEKPAVLHFSVNEDSDIEMNRGGDLQVKLALIQKSTGDEIGVSSNFSVPQDIEQNIPWSGSTGTSIFTYSTTNIQPGSYLFKISASDQYGNEAVYYSECVNKGIAPEITYAGSANRAALLRTNVNSMAHVSRKIILRGTAIDPVWNNQAGFKDYRFFYKSGIHNSSSDLPSTLDSPTLLSLGWQSNNVTVPELNRNASTPKNISLRPVQNDGELGYFDPSGLSSGKYTILLMVKEEEASVLEARLRQDVDVPVPDTMSDSGPATAAPTGDETVFADAAYIYVTNTLLGFAAINPVRAVPSGKLYSINTNSSIPEISSEITNIEFTSNNVLLIRPSLELTNVHSANFDVEISDTNGYTVFNTRLNDVTSDVSEWLTNHGSYDVEPAEAIRTNRGYYIWQDEFGFHVIMKADRPNDRFTGNISSDGELVALPGGFDYGVQEGIFDSTSRKISFESFETNGGEDRIDLFIKHNTAGISTGSYLKFDLYINGTNVNSSDIYRSTGSNYELSTTNHELSLNEIKPLKDILWSGFDSFGNRVSDARYKVLFRASARDGSTVEEKEKHLTVSSRFKWCNTSFAPEIFDPLVPGIGSFASVSYKMNKSAIVNVAVKDYNPDTHEIGESVCFLASEKPIKGGLTISEKWYATYPDLSSGRIKTEGSYIFEVKARDPMTGEELVTNIGPCRIASSSDAGLTASLDPIGTEGQVNEVGVVKGISDFYFESKPIGRKYYPVDFQYKLKAEGKQSIVQYPFVPFVTEARVKHQKINISYRIQYYGATRNWTWKFNGLWIESFYSCNVNTGPQLLKDISGTMNLGINDASINLDSSTVKFYSTDVDDSLDYIYAVLWVDLTYDDVNLPPYHIISGANLDLVRANLLEDSGEYRHENAYRDKGWNRTSSFPSEDFVGVGSGVAHDIETSGWHDGKVLSCDVSVNLSFVGWDKGWLQNNLVNRYTQWASENGYYFGNPSEDDVNQQLTETYPPNTALVSKQKPKFPGTNTYLIPYTARDGSTKNITITGKNGLVNYFTSQTNFFHNAGKTVSSTSKQFESYGTYGNFAQSQEGPEKTHLVKHTICAFGDCYDWYDRVLDPSATLIDAAVLEFNPNPGRLGTNVLGEHKEIGGNNLGVNGIYDISFSDLNNDPFKKVAHSKYYVLRDKDAGFYKRIHFPATEQDVIALNAEGSNVIRYPKYSADAISTLIHPNYSFVNYGGCGTNIGTSEVVLSGTLNYDSAHDSYWFEKSILDHFNNFTTNNFVIQPNHLVNYSNFKIINGRTSLRNIEITNVTVDQIFREDHHPNIALEVIKTSGMINNAVVKDVALNTAWSGDDDPFLAEKNGVVRSTNLSFNKFTFDPDATSDDQYMIEHYYPYNKQAGSDQKIKGTFVLTNAGYSNNSFIVIDKWTNRLFYVNGEPNDDLEVVQEVSPSQKQGLDQRAAGFKVKLKTRASAKKIVEIKGVASGPYSLYYFDSKKWNKILDSLSPASGILGYWNATLLNGRYSVLLQVSSADGSVKNVIQDVQVGETFVPGVNTSSNLTANAPFNRAMVRFAPNSFPNETVVSITPIKYEDIEIQNKPDINPVGPIVALRPSPYQFAEGAEPTLVFHYTKEEVIVEGLNRNNANIYQIDNDGNIKCLDSLVSFYKVNDAGDQIGEPYTNFETFMNANELAIMIVTAKVPHFSNFVVLKGPVMPSAPTINPLPESVRVSSIDISGRASRGTSVVAYVDDDPLFAQPDDLKPPVLQTAVCPIAGELSTNKEPYSLSGINLHEGTNYLFVTYKDISNRPSAFRKIVRDTTGPLLTAFSVSNDYFSPNNDGVKDYFRLKYNVNESCMVKFEVSDKSGNVIYNDSRTAVPDDNNILTWNGLNDLNQTLPEGSYGWRMRLFDSLGNADTSADKTGTAKIDLTGVTVTPLLADIGAWSPNNDGQREDAEIGYSLSEDAEVDMDIVNDSGIVVRKNLVAALRTRGSHSDIWNSMGDTSLADDGNYMIRISGVDKAGNRGMDAEIKMIKDTRYPSITAQQVQPSIFDPRSGGCKIGFYLSEDSLITASVTKNNTELFSIDTLGFITSGPNQFSWTGLMPDGSALPAGDYAVQLIAQDAAGNKSTPVFAEFKVIRDIHPPVIAVDSVEPVVFSPEKKSGEGTDLILNMKDKTALTFTFSDSKEMGYISTGDLKDVSVSVYQSGKLIRSLLGPGSLAQGQHSVEWDGRDKEGRLAQDGEYYFRIAGKDHNGLRAEEKLAYVFVDNTAPSVSSFKPINRYLSLSSVQPVSFAISFKENMSETLPVVTMKVFASSGLCAETVSSIPLVKRYDTMAGSTVLSWDGKDSSGAILGDGLYKIACEAQDEAGNASISGYEWAVIDTRPPAGDILLSGRVNKADQEISETNNHISPNPPSGDGTYDLFKVNYFCRDNISDRMIVTMTIRDINGNIVRTISGTSELLMNQGSASNAYEGTGSLIWDGKGDDSLTAADGKYYYNLEFTDRAGNKFIQTNPTQIIYIDNAPPSEIMSYSAFPDIISPDADTNTLTQFDHTLIRYTVPESNLSLATKILGQADKYDYTALGLGMTYPDDQATFSLRIKSRTEGYAEKPFKEMGFASNAFTATMDLPKHYTKAIHLDAEGHILETNSLMMFNKTEARDSVRKILWTANSVMGVVRKYNEETSETINFYNFENPVSISVDEKTGVCWVADADNKLFKIAGTTRSIFEISSPYYAEADTNQNFLWVLLSADNSLRKYNLNTIPLTIAVNKKFNRLISFSVDKNNGACWAADADGQQIIKLDNSGTELFRLSGFENPFMVKVQPDSTVWILDNRPMRAHDMNSLPSVITVNGLKNRAFKLADAVFNDFTPDPDRLENSIVEIDPAVSPFISAFLASSNMETHQFDRFSKPFTHAVFSNSRTISYVTPLLSKNTNALQVSVSGNGEKRNIPADMGFVPPVNTIITQWNVKLFHSASTDQYAECKVTNIVPNDLPESAGSYNGDFEILTGNSFTIAVLQPSTNLSVNTSVELAWNGYNKYGVMQPDNTYSVRVYETDPVGNVTINNRNVEIDTIYPEVYMTSPAVASSVSNIIHFSGIIHDKNFYSAQVEYKLESDAEWKQIGSDIQDTGTEIADFFEWDSTGLKGSATFRFTASDRAGNTTSKTLDLFLKNSDDWLVKILSVTNKIFSPNNDNIKDSAKILVQANLDCIVRRAVIQKDGITIYQFMTNNPVTQGVFELKWDGSGFSGDGTYNWVLDVERDQNGTLLSDSRSGNLSTDNTPPDLNVLHPADMQIVNGVVSVKGRAADSHLLQYSVTIIDTNTKTTVVSNTRSVSLTNGTLCTFDSEGKNGIFKISISAIDIAGNHSVFNSLFSADNLKPEAVLSYPLPSAVISGSVTVKGTANDTSFRKFILETGSGSPGMNWITIVTGVSPIQNSTLGLWNTSGLNGLYTIKLTVYDKAGNATIDQRAYYIDNQPPALNLSAPLAGAIVGPLFTVDADVSDNNFSSWIILYRPAGAVDWNVRTNLPSSQNIQYTFDASDLPDGEYEIAVKGVDLSGNQSMLSVPVTLDKTPPAIAFEFAPSPGKNSSGYTIVGGICSVTVTLNEPHPASIELYFDKAGTGTFIASNTGANILIAAVDTSEWTTSKVLACRAVDAAGNIREWTETVIADNEAPLCSITSPKEGDFIEGVVPFRAEIQEDNILSWTLAVNGVSVMASSEKPVGSYLTNWDSSTAGYNGLENEAIAVLRVNDLFGRTTDHSVHFSIDNHIPQIIGFLPVSGSTVGTNSPFTVQVKVEEQFPAAISLKAIKKNSLPQEHHNIVSETNYYQRMFGNQAIDLGLPNIKTWSDGEYAVVFQVIDRVGHISTYTNTWMIDNTPPLALLSTPTPQQFCPTSGVYDRIQSQLNLNETADIELFVTASNGSTVYQVSLGRCYSPVTNISWNGLDNTKNPVPAGKYSLYVTAQDLTVNVSQSQPVYAYIVYDTVPPSLTLLESSDPYISPNGDNSKDIFTAEYSLSGEDRAVSVKTIIQNNAGSNVMIYNEERNTGSFSISWNGIFSGIASSGSYRFIISAEDFAHNVTALTQNIIVDLTRPWLSSSQILPEAFSPNADGVKDNSSVSFTMADNVEQDCSCVLSLKTGTDTIQLMTNVFHPGVSYMHPIATLSEGNYQVEARLEDRAGNVSTITLGNLISDLTPPEASIVFNELEDFTIITNGQSIEIWTRGTNSPMSIDAFDPLTAGTFSGLAGIRLGVSGAWSEVQPGLFDLTAYTELTNNGVYSLCLEAFDKASNKSASCLDLHVDKNPPTVNLSISESLYQDRYVSKNCIFTVASSDGETGIGDNFIMMSNLSSATSEYVVRLSSGTVLTQKAFSDGRYLRYAGEFSLLTAGDYILKYYSTDKTGNKSLIGSFKISTPLPDTTPPVITISDISNGGFYNQNITLHYTVTDDFSAPDKIMFTGNNSPYTNEGLHNVVLTALDEAGNIKTTNISFTIDKTAPVITLQPVPAYTNQNIVLHYVIIDNICPQSNILVSGDNSPYFAEGLNQVILTAEDQAGNISISNISFIIDKTAPNINIFGIENNSVYTNCVSPEVQIVEEYPGMTNIAIDNIPWLFGQNICSEGSHIFTVQAQDKAGNISEKQIQFILDYTPPAVPAGLSYTLASNRVKLVWNRNTETDLAGYNIYRSNVKQNTEPVATNYYLQILPDFGIYTYAVSAVDDAGNESGLSVPVTVNYQNDIQISSPEAGLYYRSIIRIEASITNSFAKGVWIEAGEGAAPTTWTLIHAEPGRHFKYKHHYNRNIIYNWNTEHPQKLNGAYTIRISTKVKGVKVYATVIINVDNTDPITKVCVNSNLFTSGITNLPPGAVLTFITNDPLVNNVAAGIKVTKYHIERAESDHHKWEGNHHRSWDEHCNDSDFDHDRWYKDRDQVWNGMPIVLSVPGFYVLKYYSIDNAENMQNEQHDGNSEHIHYKLIYVRIPPGGGPADRIKPVIKITGITPDSYYNTGVSPQIIVTDEHLDFVDLKLNGTPYTSGTLISADGDYRIGVSAKDTAGNSTSTNVSFVIDTTLPAVTITGIQNNSYYNTKVKANVSISDKNLTSSSVNLDGNPYTSGTWISAEANHNLTARAEDKADNNTVKRLDFTIDKTPPQISITGVEEGKIYTEAAPIVTVLDPNLDAAKTGITLNNKGYISGTQITSNAIYLLSAHAEDFAGNIANKNIHFTINRTSITNTLLFSALFDSSANAEIALGNKNCLVGGEITTGDKGRLPGEALSESGIGAKYSAASNINATNGTVMMWAKPGWLSVDPAHGCADEDRRKPNWSSAGEQGRYIFSLNGSSQNGGNGNGGHAANMNNSSTVNLSEYMNLVVFGSKGTVLQIKDKNGNCFENAIDKGAETNRWYADKAWTHIAWSWNSKTGKIKLWINGNQAGSFTNRSWTPNGKSDLWIGNKYNSETYQSGCRIDDAKIFSRELTTKEIKQQSGMIKIGDIFTENLKVKAEYIEKKEEYYCDRIYIITNMDSMFRGSLFIKTANDDKQFPASQKYLSFKAEEDLDVVIGFDSRVQIPLWLSNNFTAWWENGKQKIIGTTDVGNQKALLYKKRFLRGEIVDLYGNGANNDNTYNYFVIIKK